MTVFQEITIESNLLNQIQWSLYVFFSSEDALSAKAKICDTFGWQTTENPPFPYLGQPVYVFILLIFFSHKIQWYSNRFSIIIGMYNFMVVF